MCVCVYIYIYILPHNVHTIFTYLYHLYYSPIMYTPILLLIQCYILCSFYACATLSRAQNVMICTKVFMIG